MLHRGRHQYADVVRQITTPRSTRTTKSTTVRDNHVHKTARWYKSIVTDKLGCFTASPRSPRSHTRFSMAVRHGTWGRSLLSPTFMVDGLYTKFAPTFGSCLLSDSQPLVVERFRLRCQLPGAPRTLMDFIITALQQPSLNLFKQCQITQICLKLLLSERSFLMSAL